ncbi:ATP-binding cassette domain-containing protein [Streptomyces sp. MA5143a]|uniref:ATP-binding cassette domain-containing protein n=1 Tax=Streptomyces sp. MA5143a TaxID=2083010 RepID=UPI000D1ACCB6|nr:ABC transporter ATP-binding protein [Streptomyces sp. MA5143a]SPF06095.1 putative ABC transporter ATP-binding protein [Streptomyces sp. MA5143a]
MNALALGARRERAAHAPSARGLLRATLRTRRRQFLRLAGWSLVQAVPALLSGWLVAKAVDDGFLAGSTAEGFGWLGLLAGSVLIGAWGTRQATRHLAEVVEPFRDDLVSLVTTGALRRSAHLGNPADTAGVARLTEQVEIARESYGAVVMFVQTFTVTAVSVLLGLTALDPALLLFVVPPLTAGLTLFLLALRALAARQRAVVLADEAIAEQVHTVAGGLRDVTACGAEHLVRTRTGARIDRAAEATRALARLTALRTAALGVGGWLPLALILFGAPWLVDRGVTAGAILGALTYISQSLQPALQGLVQGVGGSGLWLLVTTTRILETTEERVTAPKATLTKTAPEPTTAPPPPPPTTPSHPADGALELRHVTFSYARTAEPVVKNLDLTLPPGTYLAVVGPSGAGKSTLAALIAGLLEPRTGDIHLGGAEVGALDPAHLSDARVLIPQEAYVFTGTVRENLTYLHPAASPTTLDWAVEEIGATALVERLGGYEAPMDPGRLSAGERQQIALVRALLPPTHLHVLDEATCHLDPPAEARAERAFASRPSTLIVCAHRISSALRADLTLVLDGPRHDLGTHDELMTTCALYRDLIGHWDRATTSVPS